MLNSMLPLQTACCHCCWLHVLMRTCQSTGMPFFHTHPFRESGIIIMFAVIPFLTHVRLNSICKDTLLDVGIAIYSYFALGLMRLSAEKTRVFQDVALSQYRSPWFDATFQVKRVPHKTTAHWLLGPWPQIDAGPCALPS